MSQQQLTVGFIGAGMMASALMDGLIAKEVVPGPASITCSDIFWQPSLDTATKKGIQTTKSNKEVCEKSADGVVILAVKPNIIPHVCKDIAEVSGSSALIVSIAAGVTLEALQGSLPGRRVGECNHVIL